MAHATLRTSAVRFLACTLPLVGPPGCVAGADMALNVVGVSEK